MYRIDVTGYLDFSRFGRVLSQKKVARDPLSGVVDGSNKTFFANYYPILTSGSVSVYSSGSSVAGTLDYNTGEVTLASAPSVQPEASYTFTPYDSTQLLQFLISGFDEMEGRWTRGWRLRTVDGSGAWSDADETSANIYITDSSGSIDPLCGTYYFSVSRVQIAFYMACCEYRYYLSQLGENSLVDFQYREGLRGMLVDKTKVPANIALALAEAEKRIAKLLEQAQASYYTDGAQYGGYQSSPATRSYMTQFEWQSDSRTNDVRGNYSTALGYHMSLRPLLGV